MSKKLPEMLEGTINQIRGMIDANSVVGDPITTLDGVTIIPISKISIGYGGGGCDVPQKAAAAQEPFGGGIGAGVHVTPIAFLIIKEGSVRVLPVASPANTTADRIVEMVPDTLERVASFIDSRSEKKGE